MIKFSIDQAGFNNKLKLGTINYFDGWVVSLVEKNPIQHIRFSVIPSQDDESRFAIPKILRQMGISFGKSQVDQSELGILPIKKERPDLEKTFNKRLLGFSGVINVPEDCQNGVLLVEAVATDGECFPMARYPLSLVEMITLEEKDLKETYRPTR